MQKRTTTPAKVLGLAFLLMGAAIAVSELFYFIDRTRLLAGGGRIANSLILTLASTVIAACAGVLMLLCGSRLSAGKAYRGLAGLSAIMYCAAKVLSIVGVVISTDFSNPAMSILIELVAMVMYAGGMVLLWRIPVAWSVQDTAEAQTNAKTPNWMLSNVLMLVGIGWLVSEEVNIARNVLESVELSASWTAAILAGGVLTLLCGIFIRAGKDVRVFAILAMVCFCIYSVLIASLFIDIVGYLGSDYILFTIFQIADTLITPCFLAPFAFCRLAMSPPAR